MDKESTYELQKIDCNCNNCFFMKRDVEKYDQSLKLHHKWQLDYFNSIKDNFLIKADGWEKMGNKAKAHNLRMEAAKMKFQFNRNEAAINYGQCEKFNKPVSFIPNVCQLETQACFKHRKD